MLGLEVLGLILMAVLLSVSSLVAISGGTVMVPFAIYLLGMTTTQAVALSNFITVLKAGVKYGVSLRNRSPHSDWKTAIDYNAALAMLPLNVMLSVVGGIASSVIPGLLTLMIMVVCIFQAVYNGTRNLLRLTKLERGSSKVEPLRKPEEPQMETSRKIEVEHELGKLKAPKEEPQTTTEDLRPATPPTPITENQVSDQPLESAETAPAQFLVSENETLIEVQRKIEGNNFHWPKFLPILAMILLSVLVSLLRPGKTPTSLVGIKKCSAGDFLVLAGYMILMAFLPVYAYKLIQTEQKHKDRIGWIKANDEVYLDRNKFIFSSIWSGVSGLISTLLGIGGGILLNPLMAILQYLPASASWTINLNALVGRFAAVITHIIYGDLLYDYVLFCGVVISIVVYISENLMNYFLLKKLKSQRPYAMIFLGVVLLSLVLNVLVGVDKWITEQSKGIDVWKFKSLC